MASDHCTELIRIRVPALVMAGYCDQMMMVEMREFGDGRRAMDTLTMEDSGDAERAWHECGEDEVRIVEASWIN